MEAACARFEKYLGWRYSQSTTLKHYHSDLAIFRAYLVTKRPEAVSRADIDGFVESQIAAGLSVGTINRRLSSIHSLFEYLAGEQMEHDWPNPVVKRHHLKRGRHLPRDIPDEQVTQLLAVIDDARDRAMVQLMVGAGLRVGEVAGVQVADVEVSARPDQLTKLRVVGKGNKERMVWLTGPVWRSVQAWMTVRPQVNHNYLFVNQHGQPLSVAGIQYRLQRHAQAAHVTVSCHRLRHTFARRLAEQGLPVDSLAKLLGHCQLETTQRYIDGADPTVRSDFFLAMRHPDPDGGVTPSPSPVPPPAPVPHPAKLPVPDPALLKLRQRLTALPVWLAETLDAYLSWRWPSWRPGSAYNSGGNLVRVILRMWHWLALNRQVEGWSTFRRSDLEAWIQARRLDGATQLAIRGDLDKVRILLKFWDHHGHAVDPGLFRVIRPAPDTQKLPRYLPETEYRRLEEAVLAATQDDTYDACLNRAWFLTLAHTGLRVCELLSLQLGDLNFANASMTIRAGKDNQDRVVFLTPLLTEALQRYLPHRQAPAEEQRVFLLKAQRSPSAEAIRRRLDALAAPLGLHVYPHQLRHTLATRLLNRGMPIHSLQKLLGHQHLSTTQIYAQVYDETLHAQFVTAMAGLEPIAEWPRPRVDQVASLILEDAPQSSA